MKHDALSDEVALKDILRTIDEIEQILIAPNRDLLANRALERCFEIIGEACRRVSPQLQAKYKEIPWGNIISLRNMISHEYDKVKMATLWDIAEHKMPALKDWISGILDKN
jgi:uncharacterized protein with HEPN domain